MPKGRITIGYTDRGRTIFTPFSDWRTIDHGGDVPWTRVHYFRYGDEPLWDREARTCALDAIRERNKALPKAHYGVLRVATWNVQRERAAAGLSREESFAARTDAIIAALQRIMSEVDFVFLQEVPDSFMPRLAAVAAASAGGDPALSWHLATSLGAENVADHVALMSRFALVNTRTELLERGSTRLAGSGKSFLVVDVLLEDMQTLRLINVHLTSARQSDSASKRATQLGLVSLGDAKSLVVACKPLFPLLPVGVTTRYRRDHHCWRF